MADLTDFNPVPSLTATGWMRDPLMAGGQLLAYFIESDYSQSNTFLGQVLSLPYIVQKFNENPSELCSKINSALTQLFSRQFSTDTNNSNVTCDVRHDAKDDITRYNFTIDLTWYVSGTGFQLGRAVTISKSIIEHVIDTYNN